MAEYRAYTVGFDGHFASFEPLVCHDDAEAIAKARSLVNGCDVEVWSGELHGFGVDGSAPLRSAVSLLPILKPRDKRTPERSPKGAHKLGPASSPPRIVEQLVDVDVPFSVARRQPAAILRRLDLPHTHPANLQKL
jgi:hypothetical protein